jgi:transcription elongation factor Elf1
MPQIQLSRREANRTDFSLGLNTREQVKKLRISNLFMSMSVIAVLTGISRQRVFQILQEEGLPTKHLVKPVNKDQYSCLVCGKIGLNIFCSNECQKQYRQIPIVCTRCGKLFFRDVHQLLANYRDHSDTIFCSRNCQSRWIGAHYGFKSHPNHSGPGVKRKHNWEDVWKRHLETGYGAVKLSRQLGIPETSVAYILFRYPKQQDL